jgi:hypothetical protein
MSPHLALVRDQPPPVEPPRWLQLSFPAAWAAPAEQVRPPPGKRTRRAPDSHRKPVQQAFVLPTGRKCSPVARARTVSLKVSTRKQRNEDLRTRDLFDVDIDRLRPRTRADCINGPRPCPWVGCRHHLAISWDPERPHVIKETWPHLQIVNNPDGPGLDILEQKYGTCELDICDKLNDGTGEANLGGLLALRLAALSGKPLGVTPGMSIQQTGRHLNISVERARQLASLAMQELRIKLRRGES